MLTILVVFLVIATVNKIVVYLEVVVCNCESLKVSCSKGILIKLASGSMSGICNSSIVLVALSCCKGLTVSRNSGSGAASLVWA